MASSVESNRTITFLETLGRGGFGEVYLAELRSGDNFVQRVAIKLLNEAMGGLADIVARHLDEARLLAQLNHEHIVRVMDLTEINGRPAVIMEYVEGVDADKLLKAEPLPVRAALEIATAAASALDAAHRTISPQTGRPLQVVHRDIKPANLLVSPHGGVKVLDFGVARADFDREGRTRSVQYGTARFMAPETWLHGVVSPAVDVYALGVSVVEMIAGAPFERPPLTADAYHSAINRQIAQVEDPSDAPGWRSEVRRLLADMMAWDPAARPSAEATYDRAQRLADEASGESLRRFARRSVPPCLEAQRARMRSGGDLPPESVTSPSQNTFGSGPHGPSDADEAGVPDPASASGPHPTPRLHGPDADLPSHLPARTLPPADISTSSALDAPAASGPTLTPRALGDGATPPPKRSLLTLVMAMATGAAVIALGVAAVGVAFRFGPAPLRPDAEPSSQTPTAPATTGGELRCEAGTGRLPLDLRSDPEGARVWVDGVFLGATPLLDCGLPRGEHVVRVATPDGVEGGLSVQVKPGGVRGYTWRAATDAWESAR